METVKEKLIELIQNGGGFKCGDDAGTFADIPCDGCRYEASEDCMAERIADALIQNGVTIQEWVRTSERKPTKEDADKLGCVLAYIDVTGIILTIPWYDVVPEIYSHWTATPQPPKEVE